MSGGYAFNSQPAAGFYYLQSAPGYMPPLQPMNYGQNYYMQQPNPNVVYVQQPLPNQFYNPGLAELLCLLIWTYVTFLNTQYNQNRLTRFTDSQTHFALFPGFRLKLWMDFLES
ncbi:hypothetical protein AQUCO_00800063v1 [Aquilegia coerulea]|uniref:Uncharacterized protein n=1 Tax=Aquilegia coerulea TaxID=218851 RepID=A0A2G5EH27_AQUCA|nr:hypothetical protein AQUCO_00800063v1 [Aquilegia coerulea]